MQFWAFAQVLTSSFSIETYLWNGSFQGASDRQIKKAYRTLSLKFHPDKREGDETEFVRIAKAYEA